MFKKYTQSLLLLLAGLTVALSGCSSSGEGGASLNSNSPTIIGNTIFTDDVVTDGKWMVWEGRKQNFMFNTGTENIDLTKNLDPKYNLGTNNDDWGDIHFDGRYVVFFADDVTDAAPAQPFYIDTEDNSLTPTLIGEALVEADNVDYDETAVDNGIVAIINNNDVFYQKLSTGVKEQLTDDATSKSQLTVSGSIIAYVGNNGHIYTADVDDTTPVAADIFTPTQGVSSLQGLGGVLAWYDNGGDSDYHVYYSDGTDVYQATANSNNNSINNLAMNAAGTIAWRQGNEIRFRVAADDEMTSTSISSPGSIYGFTVGTGFIAWSEDYSDYSYEISLYNIDADAITTFWTNNTSDFNMWASGSSVFWYVNNEDIGDYPNEDPSKYLYKCDTATSLISNVSEAAFQMIEMDNSDGVAAGSATGQIAWRGHAQNRTLYATSKGNMNTTYALTPPEINATQPSIDNGILAFTGFDRTEQNAASGEDDHEVYFVDLNNGRNVVRITSNFTPDQKPFVSGRLVSWKDNHSNVAYYYNLDDEVVTLIEGITTNNAIRNDGRFIAFRDNNNDLYYYDTEAATPVATLVAGATDLSKCPNISKGIITWNDAGEIWYMDLTAATPTPVDVGAADYSSQPPTTDGRYIVWGGDDGGDSDYTIKYRDTEDTTPEVVELTADNVLDVCIPRLSNGVILFAAVEYGEVSVDGDRELFAYDLNATAPEIVPLTDNDLWDSSPDIGDNIAIWRTGGGDNNWDWSGKIAAAIGAF